MIHWFAPWCINVQHLKTCRIFQMQSLISQWVSWWVSGGSWSPRVLRTHISLPWHLNKRVIFILFDKYNQILWHTNDDDQTADLKVGNKFLVFTHDRIIGTNENWFTNLYVSKEQKFQLSNIILYFFIRRNLQLYNLQPCRSVDCVVKHTVHGICTLLYAALTIY